MATYRRLLREATGGTDLRRAGERVAAAIDAELVDELEGIAAGAGQDVLELLAINARTELLAGGCSVLARGGWLAQTWDWHPDLAAATVVWTILLPDDRWLTTLTEAGALAKLGISSAGLACGLNFLRCSADGGVGGTPIHVLLRQLLSCAGAGAARELLLGARTTASSCVTVVSGDAAFAVELSPGGAQLLAPDADGWLVHTNHFLRPPLAGRDEEPADGTRARRAELARLARAGVPPRDALAAHAPAIQPICRDGDGAAVAWAERRATLAAIWAQPAQGRLAVAAGPPCREPFVDVTR